MDKHVANLRAGFGSFSFIPKPIVISKNNWNPKLELHNDYIEYRGGFFKRRLRYENVKEVDIHFYGKRTNNLKISKSTGLSTFIGNFKDRNQLQLFLKLLKEKGCYLSSKAEKELEKL